MSATLASSCWHIANHTVLALMMQIIIHNHTAARGVAVARMPQWTTVRRERDADSWLPRYYRNHHAGVSTHFGLGMFSSRVGWESVMRLYGMLRHKTWGTHQARPVSLRPAAAHGLDAHLGFTVTELKLHFARPSAEAAGEELGIQYPRFRCGMRSCRLACQTEWG